MHVIATAGHVDHGKSALLRALTGMEPDRWAEEQRRGMTIDLGFAWMTLPSGEELAFVDVPGHSHFVSNMLAGVGPVPAVLFVVAADGGWMPQSAEHLAAVDALGISHGVLAVTRADLADPGAALAQARAIIRRSSLGDIPAVAVSAVTGESLPELVDQLGALVGRLPEPDVGAAVRIWVDRAFSVTGSGTVVTGTLPAGTVRRGEELLVTPSLRPARIRGLQSLGRSAAQLAGIARAALNLRGIEPSDLARGMALVQPGRWTLTRVIDVRITATGQAQRVPRQVMLHIGSARTPATVRPLGSHEPGPALAQQTLARLTLRDPLPLHVGDRVLIRDPGVATPRLANQIGWPGLFGAVVLDVAPPPLRRRGAAAAAAAQLATWPDHPSAAHVLARHQLIKADSMAAMGLADPPAQVVPGWLADPDHWAKLAADLVRVVTAHARQDPLRPGMPVDAARATLGLPDRRLVTALIAPPLRLADGLITTEPPEASSGTQSGPSKQAPALPALLVKPIAALLADLAEHPFSAPGVDRLRELGLDARALAAAERHGALVRITDQIVLAPGASQRAALVLARLPQPFTATQARTALGTTRRTLIPLLEYLDRAGLTRRLSDDRREVVS